MKTRHIKYIEHQINNIKSITLVYLRNLVFLHVAGVPLLFAQPAYPQDVESTDIVYQLYKNYGWEALFSSPDDAKKSIGDPLLMQSKEELEKYFDDKLVHLILKEADCIAKKPGEICKLEFNPIFASQDASASELSIKSINPRRVDVQFVYPSNHEKIKLSYVMIDSPKGWRIADIKYIDSHASLKNLLER